MLYEEPEYARSIQIRFLNDGLKNGECCVYSASDQDSVNLTKIDMVQSGIDIDKYMNSGLLQFHVRNASIYDPESYYRARTAFQKEIENTFVSAPQRTTAMPSKIRGVGSIFPFVFTSVENANSKRSEATSQLLVENLFQSESSSYNSSFKGAWMCTYQVNNILENMTEDWMKQVLGSHDAVMFLPKLSNGIALNTRK